MAQHLSCLQSEDLSELQGENGERRTGQEWSINDKIAIFQASSRELVTKIKVQDQNCDEPPP